MKKLNKSEIIAKLFKTDENTAEFVGKEVDNSTEEFVGQLEDNTEENV